MKLRSQVDTEGSVEFGSQYRPGLLTEDKQSDFVIRELKRYDVKVAALQETRWFSNNVYHVGDSVILAAGRSVPSPGIPH